MNKVVRKMFFAWQLDKEKLFLESMALKGYLLVKVGLARYEFVEIEPKKVVFQFDFRIISKKNEAEYIFFFDEWTYVDCFGSWYYFYTEVTDDRKDYTIFSDTKSKKDMYSKLLLFITIGGLPLYYNLIFIFPNYEMNGITFISFYGFFMTIVIITTILHIYVCVKLLKVIRSLGKSIVE